MRLLRNSFAWVLACLLLFIPNSLFALSSTVTPAFVRLSVSDAQQKDSVNIAVTNNNDAPVTYALTITDVDVSTGSLLPTNNVSELTKKVVKLQIQSITIAPKKSGVVVVGAENDAQLSPGGHYVALKIEPVITSTKNTQSNVQQVLSVPIFITKEDGATHELSATINAGSRLHIGSLPKVSVTLKNTGNTDGAPHGFVSIIRGSTTYEKQTFNDTSLPLFASQEHTFEITPKLKSPTFIGRYQTIVSYKLDGQEQPTIYSRTSWFVPWWSVAFIAILLVLTVIIKNKSSKKRVKSD